MAEQGIVGRGVLLDVARWRLTQNPPVPYDPFSTTPIPLSHLLATAASQGTEIKFGDILIVRSGYLATQNKLSEEALSQLKDVHLPSLGGVEQSEEMLKWIWERFSAVAGDHPSFECWRMLSFFSFPLFFLSPSS
jgi:hypothetical protein